MRTRSLSRFAHSTDSSMFALLVCQIKDVENTHPKRFSILLFLVVVRHLISQNKRKREGEREKKKEKQTNQHRNKNKNDNDNEKTIF
jgi:hypothetical protein